MKKLIYFGVFFVFVILVSSFTSAGFFEDFYAKITGKASAQATNVSVSVAGTNAVTINVFNGTITGFASIESNPTSIEFWVTVTDSDGVNDINDSATNASFEYITGGEAIRSNSSCIQQGADIDGNSANFTCTIVMWYFDASGDWNITVYANDLGNLTAQSNTSQNFQYGQTTALVISPNELTWTSVSPGQINATSNNDPTLINNTGNFDVASGGMDINATNLLGVDLSEFIPVANFSLDIDTGGNAECIGGTTPVNNTDTSIINSIVPSGNNSLSYGNETSGQEQIYYCITEVPSAISSQTYSTTGYGSWTLTMT